MQRIPWNAGQRLTLAHLSDPHLTSLSHLGWRQLTGKRLLGYLSWQRRRQYIHRPQQLARLCQDLQQQQLDHVLVSGDLTQLGSAAEFCQARDWLQTLGRPDGVTVVPGNHDCYTRAGESRVLQHWQAFVAGDAADASLADAPRFPFRRRRGPVDIIGLNSAVPTGCTQATGRLGEPALVRLQQLLHSSARAGQFRLLVIHHPPQPGAVRRRKRLLDSTALAQVLDQEGAELIVHGHSHHVSFDYWRAVPVLGISSASSISRHPDAIAAWHLIDIEQRADAHWQLRIQRRRLAEHGPVLVEDVACLQLPRPQ